MRAVITGSRWDAAKHGLRVPPHDAQDRGVLCVLWVGQAEAQPSRAQINALRSACRSDYMAHCSRVNPNGPGAFPCLQRNAGSLSPKCRAAVSAVESAPAGAKPAARPAPQQGRSGGGSAIEQGKRKCASFRVPGRLHGSLLEGQSKGPGGIVLPAAECRLAVPKMPRGSSRSRRSSRRRCSSSCCSCRRSTRCSRACTGARSQCRSRRGSKRTCGCLRAGQAGPVAEC
jgi:hypothetical protein